ncbi:MAG TPA: DUF2207 domain-containing protein [Wenzhouxiangellaceae bacterium]|nr:DUF2207 domain-containing protein [Wenzhouxiangellaceae bacterium]
MSLNDKDIRICLLAYLLTAVSLAWGHESGPEYIDNFNTDIRLTAEGVLEIRHDIQFHAHGDEIRRGLFFELPDEVGPLSGFTARINDRDVEPDFDDGAIVVAAPEPLAVQQIHRMQVGYRAEVPLREISGGGSALEWLPVIGQFELPWRRASISLAWPESAVPQRLPPGGERVKDGWRIEFRGPVDEAAADSGSDTDAVQALVFHWQPGLFSDSVVRKNRAHWGWRTLLALAITMLWGLIHSFWRAVGRDPEIGRVRPSAQPPSGISPAAARYIERMGFDAKAFVAALVSLRVKGRISLEPVEAEKKLSIARLASGREEASPGERALEKVLFADSSRVELKPGSSVGAKASSALSKALGREHRGRHFETNNRQRIGSFLLGAAVIGIGIGALISEFGGVVERDPIAIALGFAAVAAGVLVPLIYFELMKAPTRAGVVVRREVEELRLYMSDTSPATSSVDEFAQLLPYAVALETEEEWQARFGDRLGDSEGSRAADVIDWYRKIQDEFDSTAAIVTIIAASTATTSVSASAGGASAGGV